MPDPFFFYFAVSAFVLGLIIGSFLNVVVLRHNTGLGLRGRSACLNCGRKLSAWELIPVFSFLALRGRCRGCRSALSWQYPFVELSTAVLFLLTYLKYADCLFLDPRCLLELVLGFYLWAVFVSVFVYDLKHKIIPDSFILPLILVGIVYRLSVFFLADVTGGVYELLAPLIVSAPLFLLWLVSKGRWIGLGDAKLAFVFGLFLGLLGSITSIIYAFWIGAIVSVGLIVATKVGEKTGISLKLGSKELTMKSEIAFGPFLIIGAFLVYFLDFGIPILNLWQI